MKTAMNNIWTCEGNMWPQRDILTRGSPGVMKRLKMGVGESGRVGEGAKGNEGGEERERRKAYT